MRTPVLPHYARAFVVMAAIVVAGTLALTLAVAFGPFSEQNALPVVYGLHLIALVIGGVIVGSGIGERGWLHGLILGALYAAGLWLVGFLAYDAVPDGKGWALALLGTAFATAGGMVGVGRKNNG
ncbi:MAG: TIGR04086 family membrane protein [Hydrogenibacillus sp.]|nr:TIGR04086 family membrane protein [Hydrogenibacillus sp.]